VESLTEVLRHGSWLAVLAAFAGGVISSLNPCCVPIYPAAAGCCTAFRADTVGRNLRVAAAFVLGGCATTTVLGITSALAGRVFMALGSWPVYLLSAFPILFGLHLLGVVNLPLPSRTADLPSMKGAAGAAVTGALLGLAVVPCATPVLGGILSYVAATANPVWGGLLLFAYGLGLGIPALLLGTASASAVARLSNEKARKWADYIAGTMLVGVGLYLCAVWTGAPNRLDRSSLGEGA
jgi:cytochrome c-type biogenesis protein